MATPAKPWIFILFACSLFGLSACSDSAPKTPSQPQAAPQAQAGKDQTAGAFNLIYLDGSASKAENGGQLSYQWKQLNTNWVVVDGGLNNARVSLYIPAAGVPAEGGEFELTVTDSSGNSNRDRVKILPELCAPSAGELMSNCFSLAKQPVHINKDATLIKEGYGNSSAQMQWALIDGADTSRGKVLDVKTIPQSTPNNLAGQSTAKKTTTLAIQTAYGHPQDISSMGDGFIEVDIRIVSAASDAEFFTGISCLNNCAAKTIPLSLAQGSQWQHIKLPLRDYFTQGINLSEITQMLAISVLSANTSTTHFQIDNIKWLPEEGGSLPADLNLAPSNPLQLGFPAPSGTTASISALIPGIGATNFANGPKSSLSWEVNDGSLIINRRSNQESELIIDLSNTWGPNIATYLAEYSLRFNIDNSSRSGFISASFGFGFGNGNEMEFSNEQQINLKTRNASELSRVDIPLSSFSSIGASPVRALRLRMTGATGEYPIKLPQIELAKANSALSAAVSSPLKIGTAAQAGEIYSWKQSAGTDLLLINNTKRDSAQIEFTVPSQNTSVPLILVRETTASEVVREDIFVIYRVGQCKLPDGVLFQDCLDDRFGPVLTRGTVQQQNITYAWPLYGVYFAIEQYNIVAREVVSADPAYQKVLDVIYKVTETDTYNGVFEIPFAEQQLLNWQAFAEGSLEFDLNIIDYGDSGELIKVGSGALERTLAPQPTGQWRHMSIPIPTAEEWLFDHGQNRPFYLIAPDQRRGGLHYQIDNIHFKKAVN